MSDRPTLTPATSTTAVRDCTRAAARTMRCATRTSITRPSSSTPTSRLAGARQGKRPELKRISGQEKLPVLKLADGSTVNGSGKIVKWAKEQAGA